MTPQPSFSQAEFAAKKKIPRREKFLVRMAEVIPWAKLRAVMEPHDPPGERGRPPIGLERMRRVYFLQPWQALAGEALEDARYDSQARQSFARLELAEAGGPDATPLLKFRRWLETHALCQGRCTASNADLAARGRRRRAGPLVDATLIAAPPSTKNSARQRAPEMHQPKQGNQWYFGMKAHLGAERDSKLVHPVVVRAAHVAAVTKPAERRHGPERQVHGDAGYPGVETRPDPGAGGRRGEGGPQGGGESPSLGAGVRGTSLPQREEFISAAESAGSRAGEERAPTLHALWTGQRGDRSAAGHGVQHPPAHREDRLQKVENHADRTGTVRGPENPAATFRSKSPLPNPQETGT